MELKRRVQKFACPREVRSRPGRIANGITTGMMPVVPKVSLVTGSVRHIATATREAHPPSLLRFY
jgi:hypothetical protein